MMNRAKEGPKCIIRFQGFPPVEYDFTASTDVSLHLQAIASRFGITADECNRYTLMGDGFQYITPDVLASGFDVGKGVDVVLLPEYEAASSLRVLKDGDLSEKKKTIFSLGKTQLRNPAFSSQYIQQGGISALFQLCSETTGATLAFALTCLEACLGAREEEDGGEETVLLDEMVMLVDFVDNGNLNVSKSALKCLVQLLQGSKANTYTLIQQAIDASATKKGKDPYSLFLQSLEAQDIDICVTTLRFLNTLLMKAETQTQRARLLQILQQLGGNFALQKLSVVGSEEILKGNNVSLSLGSFLIQLIMMMATENGYLFSF